MEQAARTHICSDRLGHLPSVTHISNLTVPSVCNVVGVTKEQVVRSLLARLPPGAKIPVHHDTGYWVRFTHRCHIAIVTDPAVHFYVGPTPDRMTEVGQVGVSAPGDVP